MGETGKVMDSDWLGPIEEGIRLRLVGVVTFSAVAVERQERSEVAPDKVREEEFGAACEGFGVAVVSVGEDGAEVEEDWTDEEGMGGGELAADEEAKGEVMRGIGEDGWGENSKAGD